MTADLFPKPKRRMKQPTKAVLRQRLADAEEAVVEANERAEYWKRVACYAHDPGVNEWLQAQEARLPKPTLFERGTDGSMRPVPENQIETRIRALLEPTTTPPGEWIVLEQRREPNPITAFINRIFRRAA